MYFTIIPRYQFTVEKFIQDIELNLASLVELGSAVLYQQEKIHDSGYTHNDLKLNNIMLGYDSKYPIDITEESVFKDASIHLIDFGCSIKFQDRDGKHLEQKQIEKFRGNILFASANQMQRKQTSRRDDLISLCYLLVYLINGHHLFDIPHQCRSAQEQYAYLIEVKLETSAKDLCQDRARCFLPFVSMVFDLGFKEKPCYQMLTSILDDIVNEQGLKTSSSTNRA